MAPISKLLIVGALALTANAAVRRDETTKTEASKTATAEEHIITALWPSVAFNDVAVSVISVGSDATTYSACEADYKSVSKCGSNYTIIAGPSTASVLMPLGD